MSRGSERPDFERLARTLSLTDLVRLQDLLSRALVQRFERRLALVFSDIVGSTAYFARFGDEPGRALQQRHVDHLQRALTAHGGRIVDTAGDGAFAVLPDLVEAARAIVALVEGLEEDNERRAPEHRLRVRVGLHHGRVLTDGKLVSGDAVNLCARVAASADPQQIRLTRAAVEELADAHLRLRCHKLGERELKGVAEPVELVALDWRDPDRFPTFVRTEDGAELPLPPKEVVRFGRLPPSSTADVQNDVVITSSEPARTSRVSRYHFELHRHSRGYVLRSVTQSGTEVDGRPVARGEEVPVGIGTTIVVSGVVTLTLVRPGAATDATLMTD